MSLASVDTVVNQLVRALGDAGVSGDVEVRFSAAGGVHVTPTPTADDLAWRIARVVVADLTNAVGIVDFAGRAVRHLGALDGVPVAAYCPQRIEVVSA